MSKLPFHEWLIICLLIATLLMLSFIIFFWRKDVSPPIAATYELNSEIISVTISGAVKKPGPYDLKKGTLLKELLERAQPLPEANLERLKMNSKLRDGQVVKIAGQKWITIHLEGAVEQQGPMQVKLGTQLQDLPELVTFAPEADLSKLQKKRRLKDEEVIIVPVKKTDRQSKPRKKKGL